MFEESGTMTNPYEQSEELVPAWTTRADEGMVCSIDHLASQAGIEMLRIGGTAVDAAIATSAVAMAASTAVPPMRNISIPACEARWSMEQTIPSSARVVQAGTSSSDCS